MPLVVEDARAEPRHGRVREAALHPQVHRLLAATAHIPLVEAGGAVAAAPGYHEAQPAFRVARLYPQEPILQLVRLDRGFLGMPPSTQATGRGGLCVGDKGRPKKCGQAAQDEREHQLTGGGGTTTAWRAPFCAVVRGGERLSVRARSRRDLCDGRRGSDGVGPVPPALAPKGGSARRRSATAVAPSCVPVPRPRRSVAAMDAR